MDRITVTLVVALAVLILPAGSALADGGEPLLAPVEEEPAPLLYPVVNPTGTCQRCDRDLREQPPGSGNLVWVWACFDVPGSPTYNSSRQCTARSTGCTQSDWCLFA